MQVPQENVAPPPPLSIPDTRPRPPPAGGVPPTPAATCEDGPVTAVTATSGPGGPPPRADRSSEGRRRLWVVARVVLLAVLAYVGVQVVVSNSAELSGATDYLGAASPGWVVLAVLAEAGSYLNFTLLQRRLLAAGGLRVPIRPLAAMSLAGNAMTNTLPGGGAFATVFAYRQFRRRGADEALTTWTLVAFTALTAVTLAALSIIGLAVVGDDGPVGGLAPLIALLIAGPAVGVAVLLRPRLLRPLLTRPLQLCRRVTRFPRADPAIALDLLVERLETVTPRGADWAAGLAFAAGNWVADCLCLVLAFQAVGATVPWRGLLVAYGAAQVVANLPVTPGGLGVVEGSLTVALVAFGGATAPTVAGVLLYRIVSFWAVLPLGWLAWLGLRIDARRHPAAEEGLFAEAAAETVALEPTGVGA